MKPLILINFKAYPEGTGRKALELAKSIKSFRTKDYQLAVSPQLIDLKEIAGSGIMTFAQHLDDIYPGAKTGGILPEAVKEGGAKGSLINHSEKKIPLKQIGGIVTHCRRLGLISIACAGSLREVKRIAAFFPDYIAYEPKKLIGGNISVTEADPKVILGAVKLIRGTRTKLLCGAGIHDKEDILKALELGAAGVLISHKIVRAKRQREALRELLG